MSPTEDPQTAAPDAAWADSLRQVFREVVEKLPDEATLGELVEAARNTPMMQRALDLVTVAELVEAARRGGVGKAAGKARRRRTSEDPAAPAAGGPQVIRRRADVPDGDLRVLSSLAEHGPVRESELATLAKLTSDQTRLVLRSLRTRGMVHFEGSGPKRRVRITRHGSAHLRRQQRSAGARGTGT